MKFNSNKTKSFNNPKKNVVSFSASFKLQEENFCDG